MVERITNIAREAEGFGVLCVHTDADDRSDANAFKNIISPAFEAVKNSEERLCKNLIAIVPIQMTESWMIADAETFKREIRTNKSNRDLGLPQRSRLAENIASPKDTIQNAIREAYKEFPSRRKRPDISELYTPLSQKIQLDILSQLSSYKKFRDSVQQALQKIGFLQ